MRDIGKNIRELRLQNHMTQDALAEALFVTRQTVSNYETGRSRPDLDMLVKIAELFRTDVNAVLYGASVFPDRQGEFRRLLIALAACSLLGLPLVILWGPAKEWIQQGTVGPKFFLQLILLPLFLVLFGWTLMQGLSLLLKAKIPQFRWSKYGRWVVVMFLVLYFALMLPPVVHFLKSLLVDAYFESLQPQVMALHGSFSMRPDFLNWVSGVSFLFFYKFPWLFFGVGLLLRLFDYPGSGKMRQHLIPIIVSLLLSLFLFICAESSFVLEVDDPSALENVPFYIQVEQYSGE